ncbi:MAG: hypothetical protein KC478_11985 [Bacteriovoracaceae bacterium]|nr:hypothetical protein [Bacteriovoracaceae bacterium]
MTNEPDIIQMNDFLTQDAINEAFSIEKEIEYPEGENYAGRKANITESLKNKVSESLIKFGHTNKKIIDARLRVATHNDINDFHSLIHTDHQCDKVLVVYLHNSLYVDELDAGTHFWINKKTKKKAMDLKNPHDTFLHSFILERDTKDLSKWDNWHSSPYKENMALMFNSLYFHSPPSPHCDKNVPGKRITLDIFLDETNK